MEYFEPIYADSEGNYLLLHEQALTRFRIGMMTGRIGDIILDPPAEMYNMGLLLDFYQFIDNDPEIFRSDFFQNYLSALERSSGKLPIISTDFAIFTMISLEETVEHIEKWTAEEMLEMLRGSQDMFLPFGTWVNRMSAFGMLLSYGNFGFIDMDNFRADFDNERFIDLLNALSSLPSADEAFAVYEHLLGDAVFDIQRIRDGRSLMAYTFLPEPERYQLYFDGLGGNSFALGAPTPNGGMHYAEPVRSWGISANAQHPDGAWEFLRGFLLPNSSLHTLDTSITSMSTGFPIRIDKFENILNHMMTPQMVGGTERPRAIHHTFDGSQAIRLYAMSETAAEHLREIVSAAVSFSPLEGGIWELIASDIESFYAGLRSAEDTARIIQNRTQTWLSEQELLARR
jgi:hypothetical protein